ncbi:MAG: hypothetical protein EU549_00250 [Promethearchaeota archaeon]|nr:MAG: hypothetical protein EU549_00250 [Candidatus Lokiarchaeota archaeon]
MSESYDYLFQIALLGLDDNEVQDIIFGMTNSLMEEASINSIGIAFGIKTVEVRDFIVRFQVWNISNRTRFAYLRQTYLSHKQGAIIFLSQDNFPDFHLPLSDVLNYSGIVPVELFLCCNVPFYEKLLLKIEDMKSRGQDLDIEMIFHPYDIYDILARDMIDYHEYNNPRIKFNVLVSNQYSADDRLNEIELDGRIETFLNLLMEKISIWESHGQSIRSISSLVQRSNYKQDDSIVNQQEVSLTELLKAMNIKIDREYKFALVKNDLGLFKVSLSTDDVLFIPKKCFKCNYKREECYKSLCIVPKNVGWSNLGLSKRNLSIISKIYFIKQNMFATDTSTGSENIITQIENKRDTCPGKKVSAKFKIKNIFYELENAKNRLMRKKVVSSNIKIVLLIFQLLTNRLIMKFKEYSLNPIKYLSFILEHLRDKLFQINYISHPSNEGSFSNLRDEMLAELRRLKEIMEED